MRISKRGREVRIDFRPLTPEGPKAAKAMQRNNLFPIDVPTKVKGERGPIWQAKCRVRDTAQGGFMQEDGKDKVVTVRAHRARKQNGEIGKLWIVYRFI